jgi:hypothetical protein
VMRSQSIPKLSRTHMNGWFIGRMLQ